MIDKMTNAVVESAKESISKSILETANLYFPFVTVGAVLVGIALVTHRRPPKQVTYILMDSHVLHML